MYSATKDRQKNKIASFLRSRRIMRSLKSVSLAALLSVSTRLGLKKYTQPSARKSIPNITFITIISH
jgi:hypothetical protein